MKAFQPSIVLLYLLLYTSLLLGQPKTIQVGSSGKFSFSENRFAFIVGNDHYIDPSISSLASCRLDAERVASFLKSPTGFALPENQMKVLLDANRSRIMKEFISLLNKIEQPETSTFYFYYSGHGLKGSIVPSDYNTNQPASALSYSWIKKELKKRNIQAKVFMIDACYAGSALDLKDTDPSSESFANAIRENSDEDKFIIYTATNAYRVTPAGKHESLYTKYLLEALGNKRADSNNDGILNSGELASELDRQLGSSNAPQFSGGHNFPMANFDLKSSYSIKAAQAIVVKSNKLEEIISWRKKLSEFKNEKTKVLKIIATLKELNTPDARARIGFLYREGIGVTKNYQTAITYFIPAALDGNSFALYNLGYLYAQGFGVTKNIIKAIEYYEKAAEQGDAFAQHNLGCTYKIGDTRLVKVNLKKAISWYTKSYDNGLAEAAFQLGKLYQDQNNMKLAVRWFKKAASKNFDEAQYELALCYQNGMFVNQDSETAIFWFNKACISGHLRACSAIMDLEL